LFRVYVTGESAGALFFAGPAVADSIRVLLLRGAVPTVRVISSVVLDRGLYLMGSALVLAVAISLIPAVRQQQAEIHTYVYLVGSIYVCTMAATWIAMRKRVPLLSRSFSLVSKVRPLRSWAEQRKVRVLEIEDAMFHFLNTDRPGFWSACALNLAAHSIAVLEVFVVIWFLSASKSLPTAIFVEGMTKIANLGGNIIPGNIGLYEAANMGILKLLGFPSAIGLAVALARDMRRIFWVGTGLVLFFASGSTSIQTN
jgi:hypothetical protein